MFKIKLYRMNLGDEEKERGLFENIIVSHTGAECSLFQAKLKATNMVNTLQLKSLHGWSKSNFGVSYFKRVKMRFHENGKIRNDILFLFGWKGG